MQMCHMIRSLKNPFVSSLWPTTLSGLMRSLYRANDSLYAPSADDETPTRSTGQVARLLRY
jgi:hypothetical protein